MITRFYGQNKSIIYLNRHLWLKQSWNSSLTSSLGSLVHPVSTIVGTQRITTSKGYQNLLTLTCVYIIADFIVKLKISVVYRKKEDENK
jgi:hypothetical protein